LPRPIWWPFNAITWFYNLPTEIFVKQAAKRETRSQVWRSDDGASSLQLGDCLEFLDQLAPDSVDCIWTDPPYLLSNDGITCVAGRMVKVNKGEWDRSRGVDLDHEFNRTWLAACQRVLKPSGAIWVSGTLHVYLSVGMAMQQLGFRILNDIVWEKPAPPPNLGCRCFTHSTEILLWATKAKKGSKDRHKFHYQAMKAENGGKQMKNVWRLAPPSDEEKRLGKHPTQKPIALVSKCLRATTDKGDVILDPFAGSGSTGVAALMLGRKFIGCEQNPEFARLASRRLEAVVETASADTPDSTAPAFRQRALFGSR
jgi:site-specific DNA-methyltransferase (adenine-specific)